MRKMRSTSSSLSPSSGSSACLILSSRARTPRQASDLGVGVEVSKELALVYLNRAIKYGYSDGEKVFKEMLEGNREVKESQQTG